MTHPTSRETATDQHGLDDTKRDKPLRDWMDGALGDDGYVAHEGTPLVTCLLCGSSVHTNAITLHNGWHDHLPNSIRNLIPGIV